MRDGVLSDVPEQNGGDRDAELRGGELAVEVVQRFLHRLGLAVAAPDERLDAGAAGGHEGELRRHEECVRRDQNDDGEEAQAERLYRGLVHGVRRNLAGADSTSSATLNYVVR